jgi:hypothetical protein
VSGSFAAFSSPLLAQMRCRLPAKAWAVSSHRAGLHPPLLIILFFTLIPSRCFSMFSNAFLTLIALSSHLSLVTAQTTNIFTYPPGAADASSVISNVTFEIGTIVTLSWETDFANVTLTAFQGLWQGAYYYTQLLSTS